MDDTAKIAEIIRKNELCTEAISLVCRFPDCDCYHPIAAAKTIMAQQDAPPLSSR